MKQGDFAWMGGLLALLVVAILLVLHYSEPIAPPGTATVPAGAQQVLAPSPVETYPPYTATPWCVGALQFGEFREAYGWVDGPQWGNEYISEYDLNRDSRISAQDFTLFRGMYGRCR